MPVYKLIEKLAIVLSRQKVAYRKLDISYDVKYCIILTFAVSLAVLLILLILKERQTLRHGLGQSRSDGDISWMRS